MENGSLPCVLTPCDFEEFRRNLRGLSCATEDVDLSGDVSSIDWRDLHGEVRARATYRRRRGSDSLLDWTDIKYYLCRQAS